MLDSFEREISCLRVSVTDRCNLRCRYCMPADGIRLKDRSEILSLEEIILIVRVAAELGIAKIRITGGEPLLRNNLCHLIRMIKAIEEIQEVALTTNGVLLKQMAPALKDAGLDRINISLDTLDPDKYKDITRGGDIRRVLTGIQSAIESGFANTKVNMVLIPGFNDSEAAKMKEFCHARSIQFQRINLYSLREENKSCAYEDADKPLPCSLCNRIRLLSDGRLKPCLLSDREIPVDFADIKTSLIQAVTCKPKQGQGCQNRGNWEIGG